MAPSTPGRCVRGTLTSALFFLSCWALPDPRQVGGPMGPWCWGNLGAGNPDSSGAQGWVSWGARGLPTAFGQRGRKSEGRGVQGKSGLPGDGVGLSVVHPMVRADAIPPPRSVQGPSFTPRPAPPTPLPVSPHSSVLSLCLTAVSAGPGASGRDLLLWSRCCL